MIELSGLLALDTLALPALAKLDHLLAQERAAKSHQELGTCRGNPNPKLAIFLK